ncbi:MAG: hypoxanthine phosphoribosyltransferase [Parvibaculaceae bacterium]|jgi:hypoxanthine phosphoribosyltransferase
MPDTVTPGDPLLEVLFSAEVLAERIVDLSQEMASVIGLRPLVVPVLSGSFIFAADLLRALHGAGLRPDVDFLSLSSYGTGTHSSGSVKLVRDIDVSAQGRSVVLVDDILESGRTLSFAKDLMMSHGAHEVHTCVLLDKPEKHVVPIKADFVGFECPDAFVVGYGMDLAHGYRELPFVGQLL